MKDLPESKADAALYYARALGWRVMPLHSMLNGKRGLACSCGKADCSAPAKHPRVKNGEASNDLAVVERWWKKWPNANIGFWLEGSNLAALDVDVAKGKKGDELLAHLTREAQLPRTLVCETPSGGQHLYFKDRDGLPNKSNALGEGLDIWRGKHYLIVPPSDHKSGGLYRWGSDAEPAGWPDALMPRKSAGVQMVPKRESGARFDPSLDSERRRLAHALTYTDAEDREWWVSVAYAIGRAFDSNDNGFRIYNEWAATARNYSEKETQDNYYKQSKIPPRDGQAPITVASIFERAKRNPKYAIPLDAANATVNDLDQLVMMHPSEQAVAKLFVRDFSGKLLHCKARNGWYEWDGYYWRPDEVERAYHYCATKARIVGQHNPGKTSLMKASFASGVEKLAKADPAFAREASAFDQNRLLLATPRGVLELDSGTLRGARPEDLLTRIATVGPEDGNPAEWLRFLAEVLGPAGGAEKDDTEEMIAFVQDWCGYGLTGMTGAEIYVTQLGPGGNGKGTINLTMLNILGDYAAQAPLDLLLFSPLPRHSTSVASLEGKRFVVASELPKRARLDEARLKMLTGGDPVTARKMNKDDRTYQPELKLTVAANDDPRVTPDEAMRRRLKVIRMPRVIKNPDPAFKHQTLRKEYGRILAWAVEGAKRVLGRGERFVIPSRVERDSEAFLVKLDPVASWMDERCVEESNRWMDRTQLYQSFRDWAVCNNEHAMNSREFYSELERRGFRARKYHGNHQIGGLGFPPEEEPPF